MERELLEIIENLKEGYIYYYLDSKIYQSCDNFYFDDDCFASVGELLESKEVDILVLFNADKIL